MILHRIRAVAPFLRRLVGLPDPTLPEPAPVGRWPRHLWTDR